jgi:hypothetical protein
MGFARCCVTLILLPATAGAAAAATQGVLFEATVAPVCTLTVGDNGTMVVSPDLKTLSSKLGGGDAGHVGLATTGGVEISVDPVTVVTPPAADTSATTWTPTYSLAGSHTVADTGAATDLDDPGSSTVTVHLVGTKSGADSFASGDYDATVTVRCE